MSANHINGTKLSALDGNLDPSVVADSEKLQAVVDDYAVVINANADDYNAHVGAGGAAHAAATQSVAGFESAADKTKLDGIAAGAEVNQNTFSSIAASGQTTVAATAKGDTLNLAGGTGITVTTNAASKTATITATGSATPGAHASSHITGGSDVIANAVASGNAGLMSGADKAALNQATSDILSLQNKTLNNIRSISMGGMV